MAHVYSRDVRHCLNCQRLLTPYQQTYCSRPCRRIWRRANSHSYQRVGHGQRRTHRLIAERLIGRPLGQAIVHHYGRISDNTRLVICENQAYHLLLHARTRVVKAGGDPNRERLCSVCRRLLSLAAFVTVQSGPSAGKTITTCRSCRTVKRKAGLWT